MSAHWSAVIKADGHIAVVRWEDGILVTGGELQDAAAFKAELQSRIDAEIAKLGVNPQIIPALGIALEAAVRSMAEVTDITDDLDQDEIPDDAVI
jgi:hypothetical protein